MGERPVRVYRLHIEWPAEALNPDGTVNPDWRPANWEWLMLAHSALCRYSGGDLGEGAEEEFKLPTQRHCLTRQTAERHLKPFLAIGCKGWVEESQPVVWP